MKIIGQPNAIRYLTQGLSRNRLSPSLLFVGPDGCGKKATALELAKCFSCSSPGFLPETPDQLQNCDECPACQKTGEGIHPDVLLVNPASQEPSGKGKHESKNIIKIASIRNLIKFLYFKPLEGKKRVVIIEEAHTMEAVAANALLKVLEEPPANGQLILICRDERNLPSTIKSRCAVIRFTPRPLSAETSSEEELDLDLADHDLDDFFQMVSGPVFRHEGRKKAEKIILHLTEKAQKSLEEGDLTQETHLRALFAAKKQIERFVPARLVLENLYLTLKPL